MASMDIEQTRSQARTLLDSGIESVTALVKTRQRITDLKEQLAEAEREDKRAYVRATGTAGARRAEEARPGIRRRYPHRRKTTNHSASDTTMAAQGESNSGG